MKRSFACFAALLMMYGCSSAPVREPPNPLTEFKPTVSIKQNWSANIGARLEESAALTPQVFGNTIYVSDGDGRVSAYAVATGERLWVTTLDAKVSGAVGVGESLVLVATREGGVIALDRGTGKRAWNTTLSSEALAAPAVGSGVVIVQTVDGKVTGLAVADGKRLWVNQRSEPALSLRGTNTPVIFDNIVVVGFANGKLAALNAREGRTLWEATIAQPRGRNEIERLVDVDAAPLVLADAIYAASYQGKLVSLNPRSGAVGWSRDVSTYTGLTSDGTNIYLTDELGQVLAFDRRSGASLWRQDALRGRRLNAPAVYKDYVVVADYEGYVHWLARQDGSFVARHRVGNAPIRAPAVNAADMLFILGHSGTLAALQSSAK